MTRHVSPSPSKTYIAPKRSEKWTYDGIDRVCWAPLDALPHFGEMRPEISERMSPIVMASAGAFNRVIVALAIAIRRLAIGIAGVLEVRGTEGAGTV